MRGFSLIFRGSLECSRWQQGFVRVDSPHIVNVTGLLHLCIIGYTVETAVMHVTRVCIMTVNRLTA